jgi:hypothetical protein
MTNSLNYTTIDILNNKASFDLLRPTSGARYGAYIKDLYILCYGRIKPLSGQLFLEGKLLADFDETNIVLKVHEEKRDLYQITLFSKDILYSLYTNILLNFNISEGEAQIITVAGDNSDDFIDLRELQPVRELSVLQTIGQTGWIINQPAMGRDYTSFPSKTSISANINGKQTLGYVDRILLLTKKGVCPIQFNIVSEGKLLYTYDRSYIELLDEHDPLMGPNKQVITTNPEYNVFNLKFSNRSIKVKDALHSNLEVTVFFNFVEEHVRANIIFESYSECEQHCPDFTTTSDGILETHIGAYLLSLK